LAGMFMPIILIEPGPWHQAADMDACLPPAGAISCGALPMRRPSKMNSCISQVIRLHLNSDQSFLGRGTFDFGAAA